MAMVGFASCEGRPVVEVEHKLDPEESQAKWKVGIGEWRKEFVCVDMEW